MMDSAKRLEMPVLPKERFLEAIDEVVAANNEYVPPYGSGATLYLRPYMFGTNPVIGVKPATEYQFRVFATPVGPYFKEGAKPVTIKVSDFDRAAPHGTGHIKAGLNYAMSLHAIVTAHAEGFDENMYLDPATRTKVEETGGANFIFITRIIQLLHQNQTVSSHQSQDAQLCMLLNIISDSRLSIERLSLQRLKTSQRQDFVVQQQLSPLSVKSLTTAKKFACQAVWKKWDLLPKSSMKHLQVSSKVKLKLQRAG